MTSMSRILVVAVILAIPATATAAAPIRGTITKIVDGDTVEILDDAKTTHRVRLHGVDAPERGAPFSRAARDHLAELVLRKTVIAHPVSRDRYGRTVARLHLRDTDVGLELLDAGMVWHWTRIAL
jgi:micrococcal nuclease